MEPNPFRHAETQEDALAKMFDVLTEVHQEVRRTNGRVTILEGWMSQVLSTQEMEKVERVAYQKGINEAPLLSRRHLAVLVGIITLTGAMAGNAIKILEWTGFL